jgi:hypothetical protein
MKVRVYPMTTGSYGNIVWDKALPMRNGKFPKEHPVGGSGSDDKVQFGSGENIAKFRAMGYWASCFPEGDGISWAALKGQSNEQCLADIQSAFGWEATWA